MNIPKQRVRVYDNQGESWDRYTIVIDGYDMALSLSENCTEPGGYSQWGEVVEGEHLGTLIEFESLPERMQMHAMVRAVGARV